jgi:hypothetical protein
MQKLQTGLASPLTPSDGSSKKKSKEIDWKSWNPFQRATGEALRQLNKRQRKQKQIPDGEPALL